MITVKGPYGIKVTILADSVNKQGNRLITYEIEYWRGILAELNTHRMLSKNSFSSRAVPFDNMLKQLNGRPVRFGANQAGMQDSGEHNAKVFHPEYSEIDPISRKQISNSPEIAWEWAKEDMIVWAEAYKNAGFHKQIFNRLLEPWQMMKTVLSGTEFDNFFWLRNHGAADPTFEALAQTMWEAKEQSVPQLLKAGEWHLPYIDIWYDNIIGLRGYSIDVDGQPKTLSLEDAIKVSCARCAAVSYRNEGYGLEKSLEVYDRLVGADRKHASAFEHVATPMKPMLPRDFDYSDKWEKGISHMDRDGNLWSGNFKGFIQYRKTIDNECYNW